MSKLIRVVLLYGGKSGEHEVSLRSAASVLTHLNPSRYQVIPIGIDKEGICYQNDYNLLKNCQDSLPVMTAESKSLPSLFDHGHFALDADVVFPVVHGPLYEDGCLQGMLEHASIAYVGSGVLSSALGMDKDMARRVVSDLVSFARYKTLSAYDKEHHEVICTQAVKEFGFPLFVKPCALGSSVGIRKVHNMADLLAAVVDAGRYDHTVLIEETIVGREIEFSVLESKSASHPPRVSIAGELKIAHPDNFYSYAAKYLESDLTELVIGAKLGDDLLHRLQTLSAEIFSRLKCRGMARVDFFVQENTNKIYFNEINTLPGFTSISMYPKLWQASGLPYASLLDELIDLCMAFQHRKSMLVTNYS